jgi:hypothetical protein
MTPDMKRLCEAAALRAFALPVMHGSNASDDPEDWEPIVRAILLELAGPAGDPVRNALAATIQRILVEPARA